MTTSPLDALVRDRDTTPPPGAPAAEFVAHATDAEDAAAILRAASLHRLRVLIWGAGTHQDRGDVADPDLILVTTGLDRIEAYEPDDLTLVVDAGVTLDHLDELLADRKQTAVLPEDAGRATVGGVVAAGLSGWRRLRYGPTRDRILEATIATGDGRVIRAGGRVVKNVTGYDIPKLATGSLGSLGVITSVCLKLWPKPAATATVTIDDPERATAAYRPLAVIETASGTRVLLGGRPSEVEAQAETLGGDFAEGLAYPDPLEGSLAASILVPARHTTAAVARLRTTLPEAGFQAAHGVGEVRFATDADQAPAVLELRRFAESMGGSLIRTRGDAIEPWGTPPDGVALHRRVKAAFDPIGVCNPGRLPGGI